jgi:hypothetical protein
MAHYAFIDENNIVKAVYAGVDENDLSELPDGVSSWEEHLTSINTDGLTCKRTSINTFANEHKEGGTPFRGNYAVIGAVYDSVNDIFHHGQPFESWTLDTNDWTWKAPKPHPREIDPDDPNGWEWSEEAQDWVTV